MPQREMLACVFEEVKSGGNFFAKKFPPSPFQEIPINVWFADFLFDEIGKPKYIEKFLERGLWRNLFQKGSPQMKISNLAASGIYDFFGTLPQGQEF
jgi:hypothetical protein